MQEVFKGLTFYNASFSIPLSLASVSLTDLMKIVLLLGMQRPLVSSRWPSILRSKVEVRAHSRLYAAVLEKDSTLFLVYWLNRLDAAILDNNNISTALYEYFNNITHLP